MKISGELTYQKHFVNEYETLIKLGLNYEEIGMLFCADMQYLKDRTKMPLPEKLKYIAEMYYLKTDNHIKAYENKCRINAENGAKGGRKKAENAARKAAESGSDTPPKTKRKKRKYTKTEFKAIVSKLRKEGEGFSADDAEVLELYEKLCDDEWLYLDRPINSVKELKAIVFWNFCVEPYNKYFNRLVFENFWKMDSKRCDILASDMWDYFDEDNRGWRINGSFFSIKNHEAACKEFLTTQANGSEC